MFLSSLAPPVRENVRDETLSLLWRRSDEQEHELWTLGDNTDGDQRCCKPKVKGRSRVRLVCHYASTSAKLHSHWRCRGIICSPEEREAQRAKEQGREDEGFLMCVKAHTIMAFKIKHRTWICLFVCEERPVIVDGKSDAWDYWVHFRNSLLDFRKKLEHDPNQRPVHRSI